ncbi:MAG TPA: hypothetical protein VFD45_02670 [Patescibacteria group bacterium]|nr:hypothetical protein [Patescibacteria group bacterium]
MENNNQVLKKDADQKVLPSESLNHKKLKYVFLGVFAAIGTFVIVLLIINYFKAVIPLKILPTANPVIAEVGEDKIYLSDYKERLFAATKQGTLENPNFIDNHLKESILNELIELKILDKNLSPDSISKDEVHKAAIKHAGGNYSSGDEKVKKAYENYVQLGIERSIINKDKVEWKEGFVLFCMYDRAYQGDYRQRKIEAAFLLKEQTAYAIDYCNKTKNRLEAGSTYEKELVALEKDPVLGNSVWLPQYFVSFGLVFNKDNFDKFHFPAQNDLLNKIAALENSKGKYSIVTIKATETLEDYSIEGKDVWNAVVFIKDENFGANDYSLWLEEQKNKLRVKTYIEKIKI